MTPLKSWDKPTTYQLARTIVFDDIFSSCFVTSPGVLPKIVHQQSVVLLLPHPQSLTSLHIFGDVDLSGTWTRGPQCDTARPGCKWRLWKWMRQGVVSFSVPSVSCGAPTWGRCYETKKSDVKIHLKWTVLIFFDLFLPKIAAGEALRVNHSPVQGRSYGEAAVVVVIVVASSRGAIVLQSNKSKYT